MGELYSTSEIASALSSVSLLCSPLTASLCLTWSSGCAAIFHSLRLVLMQYAAVLETSCALASEVRPWVELPRMHSLPPVGENLFSGLHLRMQCVSVCSSFRQACVLLHKISKQTLAKVRRLQSLVLCTEILV